MQRPGGQELPERPEIALHAIDVERRDLFGVTFEEVPHLLV